MNRFAVEMTHNSSSSEGDGTFWILTLSIGTSDLLSSSPPPPPPPPPSYFVAVNSSDAASVFSPSIPQSELIGCQTGSPNWTLANGPGDPEEEPSCVVITLSEAVVCTLLGLLIVSIIVGNVFVILSVLIFDKMRTLSNALIVSLASADLLVAIVVLPISLQHEVIGHWTLGPYVCDLWITSDVFCCTASILNIVVIALDRYWLITRHVRYTHSAILPRRKVCVAMLAMAWSVAALISTAPLLGWRRGTEKQDPAECLISQDYSYTIFSTFGAFWVPLIVILAVYFKIFHFARKRATRRTKPYELTMADVSIVAIDNAKDTLCPPTTPQDQMDTPPPPPDNRKDSESSNPEHVPTSINTPPQRQTTTTTKRRSLFYGRESSIAPPPSNSVAQLTTTKDAGHPEFRLPASIQSHSRRGHRSRSMRRSARTLGLIIGGFLICWMPFFVVATLDPFCPDCQVPRLVRSFVLWLGYSNSLLNPAIYAIWDKSFRRSFKRLSVCDMR